MSIDLLFLTVASISFFVGGLSKGAMGFGLPILAIPIMTIFGSLPLALSVVVPPVVATNLWQVWKFREHRHLPFLKAFLLPGVIGLLVGTYLLKNIENAYLEVLLGCLVLLYLMTRQRPGGGEMPVKQRGFLDPLIGGFAGLVHGTMGLSGLVGTPYFHAIKLARPAFIFSNSIMFTLFSMLHMPALMVAGLYQSSAILTGVICLIPSFLGLWLGSLLGEKLKASTFPILVQCVLAISAVLPIWHGVSRLIHAS